MEQHIDKHMQFIKKYVNLFYKQITLFYDGFNSYSKANIMLDHLQIIYYPYELLCGMISPSDCNDVPSFI